MKKLALINPGRKIEFGIKEPLNLECIAAYVQKFGIKVRIIDELAAQNVRLELLRYQPDIVGITGTTPVILDGYRIADMCRKMGIRTVIGGVHASIMPEEALEHADIVVKGEGEKAMVDIIQQDIKSGIVEGQSLKNLDDIPIYDKSGIAMDFYLRMSAYNHVTSSLGTLSAVILSSRGCGFKCTFCHNSYRGIQYRCNSVDRVIEEIRYIKQKYHVNVFSFAEDNLFMNRPRVKEICHRLIDSNMDIKWEACSRVDNIDMETLKLAYQAGCRLIAFGLESGSQRMLDVLNKKTTVEQNKKAIQMCHEVGIQVSSAFMIGSPTETVEDVRMTQEFIKDNPIEDSVVFITTPFPGTQIWEWGKQRGLIPEKLDWNRFDLLTNHGLEPISVCDTIPSQQLDILYKETSALIKKQKNKIKTKWIIGMGLRHPLKSMVIASRTTSWNKYLSRLG
jgi:radical SAM superfamily enzyme YgiQ (UPF0313 family)